MFLVREKDEMLRLMSYKSNPWLNFDHPEVEHDSNISMQDLFMFSGMLELEPGQSRADFKKFSRQYTSDKI